MTHSVDKTWRLVFQNSYSPPPYSGGMVIAQVLRSAHEVTVAPVRASAFEAPEQQQQQLQQQQQQSQEQQDG